jgi:DNA-binding MarR family transcriptional regulator
VSRAVSRHYEACLAPSGLTATQFSILRSLRRDGPAALSRLAEALVMERTSLYRALAPLERDGLVALRADPGDVRIRLADLTRKGKARIDAALPHWERAQGAFLDAVGNAEWRRVSRQLTRMLKSMSGGSRG